MLLSKKNKTFRKNIVQNKRAGMNLALLLYVITCIGLKALLVVLNSVTYYFICKLRNFATVVAPLI